MSERNNIDPVLQRQLIAESEKAKFQLQVHNLTETCWEKCIDQPGNRLDSKTETCLQSCVERFIDSSNFIVNRLEQLRKNSWMKYFFYVNDILAGRQPVRMDVIV